MLRCNYLQRKKTFERSFVIECDGSLHVAVMVSISAICLHSVEAEMYRASVSLIQLIPSTCVCLGVNISNYFHLLNTANLHKAVGSNILCK